jgi:hypothetical protein
LSTYTFLPAQSLLQRLSVGVGLLSPEKENAGDGDKLSPMGPGSPLSSHNQQALPEPPKAAVAKVAPKGATAAVAAPAGAKRERMAVNLKAAGAKKAKAVVKVKAPVAAKSSAAATKLAKVKSEKMRESLRTKAHKKG